MAEIPVDAPLELWGRGDSTNVRKVTWLCAELGLEPVRRIVGGAHGGLDSPELLALSPHGRIPVLRHGPLALFESHAILRYLAATFGPDELYGHAPAGRAPVDAWLDWCAGTLWPPIRLEFRHFAGMASASDAALTEADAAARASLELLGAELARRAHVARDGFTIADVAVAVTLGRWAERSPARPLPDAVGRWLERVGERPARRVSPT